MTIELDTGIINTPTATEVYDGPTLYDTTPSERVVYPAHTEQLIRVLPQEMVVVTAYSLGRDRVFIEKALVSNSMPPRALLGCDPKIIESARMILNRVTIPQHMLCEQIPYTILSIPGVYLVKPTADNEGQLVITATTHPLQNQGPTTNLCCVECKDTPPAEPIPPAEPPTEPTPPLEGLPEFCNEMSEMYDSELCYAWRAEREGH